jgi:hypothetical protein
MDGAAVFRLISLIPDRMARAQSGTTFVAAAGAERVELLCRFLNWLGPLNPISKEEQQLLGVRAGGGKPAAEGEDLAGEGEDALEDSPEERALGSLDTLQVPGHAEGNLEETLGR